MILAEPGIQESKSATELLIHNNQWEWQHIEVVELTSLEKASQLMHTINLIVGYN